MIRSFSPIRPNAIALCCIASIATFPLGLPLLHGQQTTPSVSASLDGLTFVATDGEKFENVKVSRVEADGLVLTSDAGIQKVAFERLPADIQRQYGYDPAKAAEFKASEAKKHMQAMQQIREANAAADARAASEKAAWDAEQAKQQQQDEIRAKAANAVAIRGKVVQATKDGLLVNCEQPEPSYTWGTQSYGGGGGPKKAPSQGGAPSPKRPKSEYGYFLIVGHPESASLADGSVVNVDAVEDGVFNFVDTTGAQRRLKKFVVVRAFK